MNFLARMIRFVFWLVIVSWSVALLQRLVAWMLRGATNDRGQSADAAPAVETPAKARRLVRDPVCGVHIAEVLAIPLREGSEVVHFCSTACRDQYAGSTRKFAANG
jgi:hypothetical protein